MHHDVPSLHNTSLASVRRLGPHARPWIAVRWLLGILVAGIAVLFLPWQQSVSGRGELTALRPSDRPQVVPAVIGGRIAAWYVAEGARVRRGQPLVRLSEVKEQYLDPAVLTRYREQLASKEASVAAKRRKVADLALQVAALEEGLSLSLDKTTNRIALYRAAVAAAVADSAIAADQAERRARLAGEGLASTNDLQSARLRLQQSVARVVEKRAELANGEVELRSLRAEYADKLAKARAERSATEGEVHEGEVEISKLRNAIANLDARRQLYDIRAPQDGYVVRAVRAGLGEQVKEGESVVTVMPARPQLAVAVSVKAVDIPLVHVGQRVRVQFDGWPVLQFSGWPEMAVGTFGGIVAVADRVSGPDGTFRILVTPDPNDAPWPATLGQGSGVYAWAMLNRVRLGYELWRRLNGFPQTPTAGSEGSAKGPGAKK